MLNGSLVKAHQPLFYRGCVVSMWDEKLGQIGGCEGSRGGAAAEGGGVF